MTDKRAAEHTPEADANYWLPWQLYHNEIHTMGGLYITVKHENSNLNIGDATFNACADFGPDPAARIKELLEIELNVKNVIDQFTESTVAAEQAHAALVVALEELVKELFDGGSREDSPEFNQGQYEAAEEIRRILAAHPAPDRASLCLTYHTAGGVASEGDKWDLTCPHCIGKNTIRVNRCDRCGRHWSIGFHPAPDRADTADMVPAAPLRKLASNWLDNIPIVRSPIFKFAADELKSLLRELGVDKEPSDGTSA